MIQFESDEIQLRTETVTQNLEDRLMHDEVEDLDLQYQTPTRHHNARKRSTTSY
jgi:hypothetical protein